jgi:sensor histidine kinase regulating citrate/malate metabolism
VEANRKLSHEDNRYIVVKLFKEEDSVNIVVENSMDGMVNFKDGLPVTSKDDTQWHGFGTRSIKQISEKYGGSIEFYCETNIFFLKIFLPSEREPSTKK